MRRLLLLSLATALAALLVTGCSSNGGGPTSPAGMGTVHIALTDAPAAYDSVVLDVVQVSVHRDGPDNEGWFTTSTDTMIDLLLLRNGVFTNLGALMVPAGHYSQVRLILGAGSYVVHNGIRHALVVPSGLQTGLKLIGGFDVPEGGNVDLAIDFDAARSIHVTGNGKYMMKPTARVQVVSTVGAISGTVSPASPPSEVFATTGADTVASTISGGDGGFTLSLLPAGFYDVRIDAPDTFRDTTIARLSVSAGQTTHLGVVTLTPQ